MFVLLRHLKGGNVRQNAPKVYEELSVLLLMCLVGTFTY